MKPAGENYKPNKMNIGKIPTIKAGSPSTLPGQEGKQYQAARVMSASPAELILIMYEQFLSLIPGIQANIQKNSPAATEADVELAQAIIEELINSLNFDMELAQDLGAIYFYVRDKIMEAHIKFDAALWDHIKETMQPLYEGFKNAAAQLEPITAKPDPLKSNQPSIISGMTYGQGSLKEVVLNTKNGLTV